MKTLAQDLRCAVRTLCQNRLFTFAVLASLAIGIGANTALFSVTSALLLRPLPYESPDRLVILWNRSPGLNITEDWFSTAQYFDIKASAQSFEQVAIAIGGNENLTGDREPERVGVIRVSSNLLPMLGIKPLYGRLFTPEEDTQGQPKTALLSFGMWERRFGRDPRALGKPLMVNGQPYQVIGILPRSFRLPRETMPTLNGAEQAEILLPLPLPPNAAQIRGQEDYNIIGRLKRGASVGQAQAEMDSLTARLTRDFPANYPPNGGLTFGVVPLREQVVGDARRPLYVLLGAVAVVLLIACANVTNLLLSRAVTRQKEIAVRQALGADRRRIVRQLLTESVLLAVCGGILGTVLARISLQGLLLLGPKSVPRLQEIGVNAEVLLFTLALCLLAGALLGVAPAFRLSRVDVNHSLKDAGRGASGGAMWNRGNHLRRVLAAAQLALSVVLLIGAGLLVRSFARLQGVNPGFNAKNVLTFGLTMTGPKYQKRELVAEAYRLMMERMSHIGGVAAAGAVSSLPLSEMFAWGPITVEGRTPLPGENFINVDMRMAAGQYLQAMEIPLLHGRYFDEHDTMENPRVALVDSHMAEQLWPGQDPVGRRFHFGGITATNNPWVTVIGIVGRVKQYTLDADARMALYVPHGQYSVREMNIVFRSEKGPAALAAAAKQELGALDANLPMYAVRTMEQRAEQSLGRRRFSMVLLGLFAALALALATLGIYGVMAYQVAQGTREIGIRMALGATPYGVLTLILKQGMLLALVGIVAGVVVARAVTHIMQSLLFGVTATDLATFSAIPVALAGVAALAIFFPARRAARVDPMTSLRWE